MLLQDLRVADSSVLARQVRTPTRQQSSSICFEYTSWPPMAGHDSPHRFYAQCVQFIEVNYNLFSPQFALSHCIPSIETNKNIDAKKIIMCDTKYLATHLYTASPCAHTHIGIHDDDLMWLVLCVCRRTVFSTRNSMSFKWDITAGTGTKSSAADTRRQPQGFIQHQCRGDRFDRSPTYSYSYNTTHITIRHLPIGIFFFSNMISVHWFIGLFIGWLRLLACVLCRVYWH